MQTSGEVQIGVLGGTGLYAMEGLTVEEERSVETPYGKPSDPIRIGTIAGRRVAFLARHGRSHSLLPSEIPYRANVHALRQLGVRWVLSASAVGSLREELAPGHFVVPLQMFDRTKQRDEHTFFGRGIVAHVSFGSPVCPTLAMVTDYDAWSEEEVHVEQVVAQLHANAALAQRALSLAISRVPVGETVPAHEALKNAILTPKAAWPKSRIDELWPFLAKYA
jgi:purine nucleoside phosphorylase